MIKRIEAAFFKPFSMKNDIENNKNCIKTPKIPDRIIRNFGGL